tara:strand:+ start:256 stop:783 length:528 start_codon:yes stop_codon:yes gene_type:complete
MEEEQFWKMIDDAFGSDQNDLEESTAQLEAVLESLPQDQAVGFQVALRSVMSRAYTWDLIGAACFIGCGQSDDGFEDFRAWLIAQGRATFERVLKDVEALAELPYEQSPTEEWHFEELHMLPGEIGGEEHNPDWPYTSDPDTPHGEPMELTKDVLRARLPVLWEKFGDEFMIGIN